MATQPQSIQSCPFVRVTSRVREARPLVQCLTNSVVMEITANALLAVGASPAMCDTPSESRDFAQVASAVLVNAGTPSSEQYEGMRQAIAGARLADTPWVLDPVACGALAERTEFARWAAGERPSAIRGNASEIAALAGGHGGRGVDATQSVDSVLDTARELARRSSAIVAVSGQRDLIVSPSGRATWLSGGHPMMQGVIGTGCSLGAMVAAYLGTVENPFDAVLAAHAHASAAGAVAAERAHAPGSFKVAWIDALYELDAEAIADRISVEEASL